MSTSIPQNTSSDAGVILLTGFAGFLYGFSLGNAITLKFSKHRWRYKFLKSVFPGFFLILAFFNIANFISLENNQFELILPTDKESSILLIKQFFMDHPFFILQIPLSIFVGLISFVVFRNKEEKQISRLPWIFYIISIIFLLTPAIPNGVLIGAYFAFQFISFVGLEIGIEQTSNLHPFTFIINWIKNRI